LRSEKVVEVWMSMLAEFAPCFTKPGQRRFAALVSGALLSERRPLVTEIVTALGLQDHWRAVEAFVEEGSWPLEEVERKLAKLVAGSGRWRGRPIDCAQGREPVERQLWAVDDLKVLKSGKKIWGACSFHEYTSRSSNRPETVWAHNWVVCGALILGPPQKAFLPTSARLYARREQMPPGESFRAKTELAVELLRNCARGVEGRHLAVFDGAYAVSSTVQPLIHPPDGQPRIDLLSRLRFDSRLYEPPPARRVGQNGRPRLWGRRLPPPGDSDRWPGHWRRARAFVYGRTHRIRYKNVLCQWHPAGAEARLHAFAFRIDGYQRPWHLVTSDLELEAQEVVELYAARFAQEDAHRDLKQQLGLGTCQGRLKNSVLRTFQLRLVTMTMLRALQELLDAQQSAPWWSKPPWYRQKRRGSLRDVKRLVGEACRHFPQLDWGTPTLEKPLATGARGSMALRRAA
jgi:hypothetical protein